MFLKQNARFPLKTGLRVIILYTNYIKFCLIQFIINKTRSSIKKLEYQAFINLEFLRTFDPLFRIPKKSVLFIVCFPV